MSLPQVSDLALKEWAVAVKSLGRGEQVLILRKGGIHREDRDFRLVHPQFLLYPTYEHQKAELIKPEAHAALDETRRDADTDGQIHFAYFCHVTDKFELRDEEALDSISASHIWSEEYARKRLHWRPSQPLTVALLRVYELQQPQTLAGSGRVFGMQVLGRAWPRRVSGRDAPRVERRGVRVDDR